MCSCFARILAKKNKFRSVELAYTATLLHDIGKLVLNSYISEYYQEVLALVNEEKIPFNEAEDRVLNFNHATIGGKVAEKWNLPTDLVDAISNHHHPEVSLRNSELTAIVHLADAMTLQMGLGLGIDGLMYPLSREAMERLEVTEQDLEVIMADIVDIFVDDDVF